MPDMLVRLYDLPPAEPALHGVRDQGIEVRAARSPEKDRVIEWVERHFSPWRPEVEAAFANLPVSCFVAIRAGELLGIACYDATCPNYFGPTGVMESERGKGIGKALLLATLHTQRAQGYAYAIIGSVGPADYYKKAVDAQVIAGSDPGIYGGLLGRAPSE